MGSRRMDMEARRARDPGCLTSRNRGTDAHSTCLAFRFVDRAGATVRNGGRHQDGAGILPQFPEQGDKPGAREGVILGILNGADHGVAFLD